MNINLQHLPSEEEFLGLRTNIVEYVLNQIKLNNLVNVVYLQFYKVFLNSENTLLTLPH